MLVRVARRFASEGGLDGDADDRGHASRYLQALLNRDARRAREVIETAVRAGVPVPVVYTEIFEPALQEVGHLWATDRLNVAQEHFATSVTQSLLAALGPQIRVAPTEGRLAIVTSTPDELHQLGTQMVCDVLEAEGWEVLNLGAATPAADLMELVETECPDLVALSASTAGRLPGVAEVLPLLAATHPRPLVVVGGALFRAQAGDWARELGADHVISDVRQLVDVLREHFRAPAAEPGCGEAPPRAQPSAKS